MTVGEWLTERSADMPAPLLARMREALGPAAAQPARDAADVLLAAAEQRLAVLLPEGAARRDGAMPLLTVDALITLGLEAAASSPADLDGRARRAMLHLAALEERCA